MNSSGYVGTGVREGVGGTLGAGEEGNESGKLSGGVYICGGGELGGGVVAVRGVVAVEGGCLASASSSSSECTRCTNTSSSTREYSANIICPNGSCDNCDISLTSYADFALDDGAAEACGLAASGGDLALSRTAGLDNNLRLRHFRKLFFEEDGAFIGERGFGKKTLLYSFPRDFARFLMTVCVRLCKLYLCLCMFVCQTKVYAYFAQDRMCMLKNLGAQERLLTYLFVFSRFSPRSCKAML